MSKAGDDRPRRKLFVKELRARIVAACSQSEVTPREIAEQEGLPRDAVNYHFQMLVAAGFLRVSRKENVRGVERNYYVAVRQRLVTDDEFGQMGDQEKREVSLAWLRDFLAISMRSWRAGTLDARSDSHLSWSPLELDEQGWEELRSASAWMLEHSLEIQARSKVRLRHSGERAVPTIFALANFEGPPPDPTKTAFSARQEKPSES